MAHRPVLCALLLTLGAAAAFPSSSSDTSARSLSADDACLLPSADAWFGILQNAVFTTVTGAYTPATFEVVTLSDDGTITVFSNDGSWSAHTLLVGAGPATPPIADPGNVASILAADIAGSGSVSIIAVRPDGVTLLTDTAVSGATPAFQPAAISTQGSTCPALLADVDNDGWKDVVLCAPNALVVLLNSVTGFLPGATATIPLASGVTPTSIDLGDFNSDGTLDFLIVSRFAAAVQLSTATTLVYDRRILATTGATAASKPMSATAYKNVVYALFDSRVVAFDSATPATFVQFGGSVVIASASGADAVFVRDLDFDGDTDGVCPRSSIPPLLQ